MSSETTFAVTDSLAINHRPSLKKDFVPQNWLAWVFTPCSKVRSMWLVSAIRKKPDSLRGIAVAKSSGGPLAKSLVPKVQKVIKGFHL